MNKSRKRLTWAAIAVLLLIAAAAFLNRPSMEDRIHRLVGENLDFLNACVENKTYENACQLKNVQKVTPWVDDGDRVYVEFYCSGFGIAPGSVYYGFYYTSKDEPVGFQAVPVTFEPAGAGWRWQEPEGDNRQYTSKIADHWYYYEAYF